MPAIIPGPVKSAYIVSIMPAHPRSEVCKGFSTRDRDRLAAGAKAAAELKSSQKRTILNQFIKKMLYLKEERKKIMESSVIMSFLVLAAIVVTSTAVAFLTKHTIDARIEFIESVLEGGGMHLCILPYLRGYLAAEYRTGITDLLFKSAGRAVDIALSAGAAFCVAALFFLVSGTGRVNDPVLFSFTLIVSVTAGPALEEIVFRHLLFRVLGRRTGYTAAAALSSVLFALIHLPGGAWLFAAYAAAGLAFCALCYYRKSLFPAFAAHALSNLLIIIF